MTRPFAVLSWNSETRPARFKGEAGRCAEHSAREEALHTLIWEAHVASNLHGSYHEEAARRLMQAAEVLQALVGGDEEDRS